MYPYKVQMLQKQTSKNRNQRVQFVEEISQKIEDDEEFLSKVHFSDEAHIHLSGEVNKQNCRFWATQQPFATVEEGTTTREKVTVWCALGENEIIGPLDFDYAPVFTVVPLYDLYLYFII